MRTKLSAETELLTRQLLIADTQRRLPGSAVDPPQLFTDAEIGRLMSAASILALNNDPEDRALAYDIATRTIAVAAPPPPALLKGAELLLARLGNFPGRKLLRKRYKDSLTEVHGGYLLRFEATMRRLENTVEDSKGEALAVTDFQYDALRTFSESSTVSVSAPTSAGKSFVLSLHIIRRLKAQTGICVVYLVPTRALIRQVIVTLRDELTKAGIPETPVRCVPTPIDPKEAQAGVIYVLTQERLLSLLHSELGPVWISILVVDEAQGIGDGNRGVLLHSTIDEVVHRFPKAELIFASPLARNPEYLLGLFGRPQGISFLERVSPVSQNLLLVRFFNSTPTEASFELVRQKTKFSLGKRSLGVDMTTMNAVERRAAFAKAVAAKDGCCLIYANGAREAEKIAEEIAREESPTQDREIQELITYLKDHVHPNYGLIEVLKKRIAFHYGNMPGSVRAGVEELCKRGKLRYVCCTSTLLQGINLPARDIVIEDPKRGLDTPMGRADFLNLAGRAGRLLREFHGNVWCLRPDFWKEKSYQGEPLQTIESALEVVVRDGGQAIRRVLDDPEGADTEDPAVPAITRIYTDHLLQRPTIDVTPFCPPSQLKALLETIEQLRAIPADLPVTVYTRNYSVLPARLELLYKWMIMQTDPRALMPLPPFQPGTNIRLYAALEIQERILQQDNTNSFRHYYHLAKHWIHNVPLGRIISESLGYRKAREGKIKERNVIYTVIEDIEKVVRYRFAKHYRAYLDVLAVVLRRRGYIDEAEHLVPFHLFLECGASNPIVLNLISLGLSRTVALLLSEKILFAKNSTPEQCLHSLQRIDPVLLKLPPYCLRELATITGKALPESPAAT